MTRRRYELTDHEWSILSPLLPNKPAGFLGSMIGECWMASSGGSERARPGRKSRALRPVSAFTSMRPREKGDGDDGGMRRSRGGLTSKIHALVGAEGRPFTLRQTADRSPAAPRPPRWRTNSARKTSSWPTRGMTATPFGPRPPRERPGPTSRRRQTARLLRILALGLSAEEHRRASLQQDQTIPRHRNPIWQASRNPRRRKARRHENMVSTAF